jgi:O-antigen/teichoic acid export membrane protein
MPSGSLKTLFLKNAFANVLGGAGAALFNLLLPALVVHHLGKLEFSVWTLACQIIVYVQLFGFGLQTVVNTHVAGAGAEGSLAGQRAAIRAGMAIAVRFCACAALAVILLVALYPVLFDDVPAALAGEFRLCLGLLGLSAAGQLFALVPVGAFTGLHRNIVPVAVQLGARIAGLLAVWIALRLHAGLPVLALALAATGFMIVPAGFMAARRWAGTLFENVAPLERARMRAMLADCMGLAVWSVAMLLVNGLDVLIVGRLDFERVAAYALATTAVTIFVGVVHALLNPLFALGASLHMGRDDGHLARLLVTSTRACAVFMVGATVLFALFGERLLPFWVGPAYAADVRRFLVVLLVAYSVRNLMAPYATLLVAIRRQRQALAPSVLEGVVNLVCSIVLARAYGAIGVAYGTLIGAVVGVLASLLFTVGRTRELVASPLAFTARSLALPACGLAMVFLWAAR